MGVFFFKFQLYSVLLLVLKICQVSCLPRTVSVEVYIPLSVPLQEFAEETSCNISPDEKGGRYSSLNHIKFMLIKIKL